MKKKPQFIKRLKDVLQYLFTMQQNQVRKQLASIAALEQKVSPIIS